MWFTPVHTGKTSSTSFDTWRSSVHPRTHGEDVHARLELLCSLGSPPYTRGRLSTPLGSRPGHTVHPRTHGEDLTRQTSTFDRGGSPPYTRGRLHWVVITQSEFRFTPVHTGKTQRRLNLTSTITVHPRTHGEDTNNLRRKRKFY